MKDTKFSVAIHILVMLAMSKKDLNSDDLAKSVGTNASYIRKVMALLKDKKVIVSQRGKSGIKLLVDPKKVTLLDIYRYVEKDDLEIIKIHTNSNKECPIGRNIKPAVFPFLDKAQQEFEQALANEKLIDVIDRIKKLEKNNESRTIN